MKPASFDYLAPTSVSAVLEALARHGPDAKILAGGQSLVPLLNLRLAAPSVIIDLAQVQGLREIEVTDAHVRVEARVTHEDLRRHSAASRQLPILRRALGYVGHGAIRNRGTVVGSLVHADSSAELPAVLQLLDGWLELSSSRGTRSVQARDYIRGPLESDVAEDELAIAAVFPIPQSASGLAFVEVARRHGDYALVGAGVRVTYRPADPQPEVVAVFTGVGPTPQRVTLTGSLHPEPGQRLDRGALAERITASIHPVTDVHATKNYRHHLAIALAEDGMRAADDEALGVSSHDV